MNKELERIKKPNFYHKIRKIIERLLKKHKSQPIDADFISEAEKNLTPDISDHELREILILSAVSFIEKDPIYDELAKSLLLEKILKEVFQEEIEEENLNKNYQKYFPANIRRMIELDIANPRLLEFDLEKLGSQLVLERDKFFKYLGLETLYSRYLVKNNKQTLELPQAFWMRVAMGLALEENDKNKKAIEFYHLMSTFRFIPSTPTLFHSGLKLPQMSSCFLLTIEDDLDSIFKSYSDTAKLLKYSGGVAGDWTNLRAMGSPIKNIFAESTGIIAFLKIANDVTISINRSGRRRGATVAYLEIWHKQFLIFLDLRRNTGDERMRTHDMSLASWIPDLFMKRVKNDESWTLFSPHEVPDLHALYGKKFEEKYRFYEQQAEDKKIKSFEKIPAPDLWRKLLTRLFETGYPWITFKDACNVRSPQDHVGVVNCSNLCTEITLNTSKDETAVCNLGSVNLARHIIDGKFDENLFSQTIATAIRALDNVIDLNYYPTKETKKSNLRHRPIGLGMMGFQDALFLLEIAYDSPEALEFADQITEKYSYYAILASSELAKEKGTYSSYQGSKWERGIFPLDTLDLLEKERGEEIAVERKERIDWKKVREHVRSHGMRNSNVMAIAPTATIANIAGSYPCIEAMYSNLYVKSNVSGEFTIVNHYLVDDLKKINLWNQETLDQIKYYGGSIQNIPYIPLKLKAKYRGVFEIDPLWMIKITAQRSKWIDQSISHNVFMAGVSGDKLSEIYFAAWKMGLKTTYYLRTLGASQNEKSTLDSSKFGYTQKRECSLDDESCESCQ